MRVQTTRRQIAAVTTRIAAEVAEALTAATGRTIWHLSETDRFKLYRLWIWKQRYKVSLEYILSVLVPYFTKGVEKRTGKKSKGLGISIPVLCGDVAEEILQERIDKDFPDGENLSHYREQEKERITAILIPPPEFPTRVRKTLSFKHLDDEAKLYKKSITKSVRKTSKVDLKMKKIPFRGNPWR